MIAPHTSFELSVLKRIPTWGSATADDLTRALSVPTADNLPGALDLLIGDGLVSRNAEQAPPRYQLTVFGRMVASAIPIGNAIISTLELDEAGYDILIWAVPEVIRPPFLCWSIRCGTSFEEGGALNERHAWLRIKAAVEKAAREEGAVV